MCQLFPFFFVILMRTFLSHQTSIPYRCGYHTNKEQGYISTPNFPKAYPVPIACQWVIEAPLNCRIAVYFTQFYLRTGFSASEFALYMPDTGIGVSKSDFGVISSNDEPTYLISNKRILVLDLKVYSLYNVHLRVTEHLLDTYGFNITYEVLRKNESVRQSGCIYHHCSFTGFCLASADLHHYRCECVTGYFGDECQYDQDCGPNGTSQVCYNGGTCRYYIGSSVRTCECPVGYEGAKCEEKSVPKDVTEEPEHKCEGRQYTSHPDYIIVYPDGRKCPPKGKNLYIINSEMNVSLSEHLVLEEFNLKNALKDVVLKQLNIIFSEGINITGLKENRSSIRIEFFAESGISESKEYIEESLRHLETKELSVKMFNMDAIVKSMIIIERMEISEKMPIVEGFPLLLACIVRGGFDTKIRWLKDHSPIVFPNVYGRLWNSTIPKNSFQSFTFLLGFDKTHILDSGTFTCMVEDETGFDELTIPVAVKQLAKPLLTPLSSTLRSKDSLTITCVSQEVNQNKNYTYFWTRNDGPLISQWEQVEDLFPSGSRLIISKPIESANYTCAIHSKYGIIKETSVINVITNKDFSLSTCPRETLFGINWKLTAVGSEDLHRCPSNYTGYIFRRCLRGKNGSAVWQEPDFSKCMSVNFLQIKNGFQSYKLGYRIHSLNSLLRKTLSILNEKISDLHRSESEPLVDILSDTDAMAYLHEDATKNWKMILNISSLLLNSSSVNRQESKQKIYSLVRNLSFAYGKEKLENNSSRKFVSSTLVVKIWKTRKDNFNDLVLLDNFHTSWNSSIVHLKLRLCNSSDFKVNTAVILAMMVHRRSIPINTGELHRSFFNLPPMDSLIPIIITEAQNYSQDESLPIKVLFTYKDILRSKLKLENLSCYKMPVIERNQSMQTCERMERNGQDILCQCLSSGFVSVVLLQKEIRLAQESHVSLRFKILPIFGAAISFSFLIYTFGVLTCKYKFSSLFE